ncbi:MAG: aminomethyl-transferring glycine dehydrogenase subunit GcvPB [Acidobacteriota bacterium]
MSRFIEEPLLFEKDKPGRLGVCLCTKEVPTADAEALFGDLLRPDPPARLPELSEVDVVRHFTRLSLMNYAVDYGLYPLGSCTMKYNPKLNEDVSRFEGLTGLHPMQDDASVQGALEILHTLERALCAVAGMDACTLQPSAGAQGEFTGMQVIRAYHEDRGDAREVVLIPDSAHGTNPATSHMAGYRVEEIRSGPDGCVDLASLKARMAPDVAAIMLTVPNTLGIFEKNIADICSILHAQGGQVYVDGANLNALMGITRPGDWGADVMHINLHKTFSTPHGGGGPGAGPVVCKAHLEPFLPKPVLVRGKDGFRWDWDRPKSIGKVHAFFGNFLILVRALCYIETMGGEGLKRASQMAVLNANYLRARLGEHLPLGFDGPTLHEVVFCDKGLPGGITTMDLAKRLIDYGFHPPTVYFPLIVHGALMVEPTETEPVEEMDRFVEAVKAILDEARKDPEFVKKAPHEAFRKRLDEVSAARNPVLTYRPKEG